MNDRRRAALAALSDGWLSAYTIMRRLHGEEMTCKRRGSLLHEVTQSLDALVRSGYAERSCGRLAVGKYRITLAGSDALVAEQEAGR